MWNQVNDALRQSASRVLTGAASVLPGVVAMLVAVLIAALIGWFVAKLLARVLRGVGFDERMDRLGFSLLIDMSPSRSPTRLVGRTAFWLVVAFGLLVGLAAVDPVRTDLLFTALLAYLPNVIVAILLLLGGVLVARSLARSVLIGAVNMQIQSPRLLSVGVKWLVLILAATMALNHLSIGGQVLNLAFGILFGGIVLALSLAVGLGSKDVVRKSWERQAERKQQEEPADITLQHF